jgi:hypothetical protein
VIHQNNPLWVGKIMVDSMKRRELLRLTVRWPLVISIENRAAYGETRNMTGEGVFLYCSERLHEGESYSMMIKLPEKRVQMTGKVTWSNLDNCTSLNFNPAMGFYFLRIDDDKDKQILRAAIVAEGKKPPRLRQEGNQFSSSPPSSEVQVPSRFGDPWEN